MRFSEFAAIFTEPPRLLKRDHAAVYLGGGEAMKELEAAGWVRPIRRTQRSALYCRRELDAAVDRAVVEGWPGVAPPSEMHP